MVMACLQTAHVEEPLRGSELGNGQLPAGMASAGEAVVSLVLSFRSGVCMIV